MKIKVIKSENNGGFISEGNNSLMFNVDLPKNAAVDYIRINGVFEVNGMDQANKLLNDIECPVMVTYHRELAYEAYNPDRMQRVAATAYFPEGIPVDLLRKVQGCVINSFEVYYHEEYIAVTE